MRTASNEAARMGNRAAGDVDGLAPTDSELVGLGEGVAGPDGGSSDGEAVGLDAESNGTRLK
jgi:hypothetical protein